MDTQQSTLPVDQSQPAARVPHPECDPVPAYTFQPRRVVETRRSTDITFEACYIGDVSFYDGGEPTPGLIEGITVQNTRVAKHRQAGLIELKIGAHTYTLHHQDLTDAIKHAMGNL